MMKKLLFIACLSLAVAGLSARFSSAAFTSATSVGGNGLTVDTLANYFSVSPGTAVQPGTSTPVASGNVNALTLDFGTVPSARTFTNVFRITNVSAGTRTANLTLSSVSQISSAVFASSGSTSVTLAAGASTTLTVTTSNTVAGRGTGSLKLGLSTLSWLYRTYAVKIDEAPEAPGAPSAIQKPAGRLDLSWTASTTTTNLAGYDLYRSSGGAYTKLNASPLTGLTYSDTATADGTVYTYKLRALSSGTPVLPSLDSSTVTATADATPPGQPAAVALANGAGAGGAYVNASNVSSLSVSVNLPANSLTSDVVQLTIANGGTVTATHAGSAGTGTVTFSGLNVSGLGEGSLTITAISTDVAGNVSTARSVTVPKDTVAPGVPTATYTDINNAADLITGSAEANAVITVTETAPLPASFSTTAGGTGAYSLNVAIVNGKPNPATNVTYTITATDVAGNTGGAYTLNYADTK